MFFFVLIFVLCFSGCVVSSEKKVEGVTNTPDIGIDNTGLPTSSEISEISEPEPAPLNIQGITSWNVNQCVEVTVQDGRIYFINGYDKGTLYSMNTAGSDMHKLNDDRLHRFYVSDGRIYYVNNSDGEKLYAINTDGSGKRKLSDDKIVSVFWNVSDGRIYYDNWDDRKLYSVKTDGSGRKKLSDGDTLYMNVVGDRIYYGKLSGDKGIYSMKADGSEKIKLSDDKPFNIVVAGSWIYYANTGNDYRLYAMRTDGNDRHKLSDDYALSINVVDDRIYYRTGNEGKIYSIKTDGSDRRLVSDDHAEWIVVSGSRIYYTITGTKIYSINTDGGDKRILTELDSDAYKKVTCEISACLREDMPEYRLLATGMTQGTDMGTDMGAAGYVMGLNVFDENGLLILSADFSETFYDQVLGNPVYNEMMDTMGLHVVDVNFDGYKDVIILNNFAGAHSNTWYNCWLWDAATSSFVKSESFASICNPALDSEKRCIYSAGGSGAAYWGGSIYKYIDGEFMVTNDLDTNWNGLVETELVNGEMVVVREVPYSVGDETVTIEMEYYKNSELWQLANPHWYWGGGHQADQWLE